MGRVEIEEGLKTIFTTSMAEMKHFNRKTYPSIMDGLRGQYDSTLQMIPELYEEEGQKKETLEYVSDYILAQGIESLDGITNKHKKSIAVLDHNMALAIAIIPLITYYRETCMNELADIMAESWNKHYPQNKITKATQENVEGGFKTKLCYITTAVCESLDKPDDCYELTTLRDYRDNYLLSEGPEGKAIVEEYYNIAPTIVKHINRREDHKQIYEQLWQEYLSPCITLIEDDKKEQCKEVYSSMVRRLQEQYFLS